MRIAALLAAGLLAAGHPAAAQDLVFGVAPKNLQLYPRDADDTAEVVFSGIAYRVPVAILNGSPGGSDIAHHLRNDADPTDLTSVYGRLLWRCIQAGVRPHVRAVLWHQGESDSFYDPRDYYYASFASLYTADTLNAAMKDYFFVTGHGEYGHIASGSVLEDGRTVSLLLVNAVARADLVSYIPSGSEGAAITRDGRNQEGDLLSCGVYLYKWWNGDRACAGRVSIVR
jgi:hypothetical protein